MQGIDLQHLLDLRPALLGVDDAVAHRRQRAVPEALAGVFLQRPERVLGVLLGLVLVEQRHDLAHHDVHRVVAQLLRHRNEPDAVLGELADVELQLEMVAEEAAEGVDHHDIEGGGLCRAGLHHALEFRPPVIGRRGSWLDIRLDEVVSARRAIGFALPALVGDRDVVLRLPGRRDAQIQRRAKLHGGLRRGHERPPAALRSVPSISGRSSETRS
ncbi:MULTISPECIES: hypothetical protein [unclassified Roseitalea]|nr:MULTISPECIES: hypothetical protein [unclassified Roseitalea]